MTAALNNRIAHLELPERMRSLKISDEGFPIPWFVEHVDGKPDFRYMSGEKLGIAVRLRRCWQCGQPLGKHLTFAIGPMCCVNRNISEPPSHLACLEYAVKACPFLSNPRARRNEKNRVEGGTIAGLGIMDNPGLTVLWTTLSYRAWRPTPRGGVLFEIGDPEHVEYYTEGRRARREEIVAVMEGRKPILMAQAAKDGPEAISELETMFAKAMQLVPAT